MILIFIFIVIFLGRSNSSLLGYEFLNTDEFVIGAKTLRLVKNNFNFYEFDGDTSGILNSIFLTWPSFFNLDITYLSIRLSAIISVSLILYITFKIINKKLEKKISILFFSPLILFFAFSKDPDFLHYSNELIATLLIVSSFYFLFDGNRIITLKKLFIVSFLSGSVLYAKMQFFPVAALNIFLLVLRELFKFKDMKKVLILCGGFLLPTILISIYYYLNQNFLDLYYNVIHYPLSDLITRNLNTENIIADTNNLTSITSSDKFHILKKHFLYNSVFHLLYVYLIFFILLISISNNFRLILQKCNYEILIISSSIILTVIISLATGSVHRHYLIFLLPMIPIFLSIYFNLYCSVNILPEKIIIILTSILLLFVTSLLFENSKFYSKNFVSSDFKKNEFNFYSPKIFEYLKLEKNDNIVAWGWKPEIYLLSNLSPASRDTVNQKQIDFKSNRNYFKKRFINDINISNPEIIIDYVKPKGYMFTESKNGVNRFAELQSFINKKYLKIFNENKDCPDFYILKERSRSLYDKLVNYTFPDNLAISKLNDFNIDEDICDTSINFDKKDYDKLILIPEKNSLNEIMILASKKNKTEASINLKIHLENKVIKREKIIIKKYPFWNKLFIDSQDKITKLELDVKDLKYKSLGLSEIKLFNNY